jgi:hypothetical protein
MRDLVPVSLYVVPDDSPNAKAEEIGVFIATEEARTIAISRSWSIACDVLDEYVPKGYFLVRYKWDEADE